MEHAQRLLAAQYRLAQHYLDKLRTAQKSYEQRNEIAAHALAMFDQEGEQVKQWQAWAEAHAHHDKQAAALCSAYAEASPDIFKLRLLPQEYLAWLEAALEAARRLRDRRAEAVHLLGLCAMNGLLNEHLHAIAHARQALTIARQISDQLLEAQSLEKCGNASRDQQSFDQARTYYEQSLALYQALADQKGMAVILNNLGVLAIHRRNNAPAQDYLEQSLALYQATGNQEGLATCLNNLGFLATRLGNYSAANDYLQQPLTFFRAMGDKHGISMVLTNLGTIAYYQEDYSLAHNYLEQGLAATRAAGIREREANCLYKLGQVTMAQGELLQARDYFEQSLALCRSLATNTLLPKILSNLAIIYLLLQQEELAYAALREALQAACRFPAAHFTLQVLVASAHVWVLKGKPLQTAAWLGLVENHPHPAVKMTDIKRDVQIARAECAAAISPEQFTIAWEEGKTLDLDTVVAQILDEL